MEAVRYVHIITIQIGNFIRKQRKLKNLTIAELSKKDSCA